MFNIVKFSLVSVLTLGLFSMPAFAQDSEADSDDDVEEVIVTGSRIKRTDNLNAPTPMVTLGAEQIELTGSINVYDISMSSHRLVKELQEVTLTLLLVLLVFKQLTFVV